MHRPAFDTFGYHANADPQLTETEAERAWLRMRLNRAEDSARLNRDKLRTALGRIAELEKGSWRRAEPHRTVSRRRKGGCGHFTASPQLPGGPARPT